MDTIKIAVTGHKYLNLTVIEMNKIYKAAAQKIFCMQKDKWRNLVKTK